MPLPQTFLDSLREHGYNSRSNHHSNALSEALVGALVRQCPRIAAQASAGELVYAINHDVLYGNVSWNTDLAIGPPAPGQVPEDLLPIDGMFRGTPVTIRIAVEHKAIMTEHGKQRLNRQRDLDAHHAHVHDYDERAIAAGTFVINSSPTFKSTLRPADVITQHADPVTLVTKVIDALHSVALSRHVGEPGLDAKCALVVSLDNIHWDAAVFMERPPAPQPGEPLHWDSFVARLCDLYARRF
jgi:hypothetical protein